MATVKKILIGTVLVIGTIFINIALFCKALIGAAKK